MIKIENMFGNIKMIGVYLFYQIKNTMKQSTKTLIALLLTICDLFGDWTEFNSELEFE